MKIAPKVIAINSKPLKQGKGQKMETEKTCKDRVQNELESELKTLHTLWAAYQAGDEEPTEYGTFTEHGLSFDYVAAGTFDDQEEGYFRYQISWGGPADEFRFFVDAGKHVHRVEYWFLDWFDGANIVLDGEDFAFMKEIFDFFDEVGSVDKALKDATE